VLNKCIFPSTFHIGCWCSW